MLHACQSCIMTAFGLNKMIKAKPAIYSRYLAKQTAWRENLAGSGGSPCSPFAPTNNQQSPAVVGMFIDVHSQHFGV